MKKISISLLFFSCLCNSFSQSDSLRFFAVSPEFNQKRFNAVVATEGAIYISSLIGLNELWYKNYPRSSFHFFNDNSEWLQMDKAGHLVASYYVGRNGLSLIRWSGLERKRAILYGGLLGSAYLTTIEILDGFSSQWGFSAGDFAANTIGSAIITGQELTWDEQRIVLKYSFVQSQYAKYRPDLLGKNYVENAIKDYNGQTYWASINLSSFMKKESKFPKWFNVALGYGADGIITGEKSTVFYDISGNPINIERYRQFYFSLDVDLTRIKTKSKFLKAIFTTFGFIKIPAPALEFNKYGIEFRALGF